MNEYVLEPIGIIRSELKNTEDAPLFYTEGAPNAHLELNPWRGGISYRPNLIGPAQSEFVFASSKGGAVSQHQNRLYNRLSPC